MAPSHTSAHPVSFQSSKRPRHASQSLSLALAAVPPTWLENATDEVRGFCQACQNIAFLTSSLFPCCKL
eukprot:scaffold78034_cov60-Phaeocystis_antarctica.AAC.2